MAKKKTIARRTAPTKSRPVVKRNPILLGEAKAIDMIRPDVQRIMDEPGVYVATDTNEPGTLFPLWSEGGKVYALDRGSELRPADFIESARFKGPYGS